LTLRAETTLPDPSSLEIQALDLGTSEQDDYAEMLASADEAPQHRLLGHPQVIQNEMQTECALVTHGLYTGDSTGYRDPRAAEFRKGAADWLLLLQIDSDDGAGMMWGDAGRLYFWIRRQDLADRRFDQAWLILQCY
jgi:uncharacterized protein YwqG